MKKFLLSLLVSVVSLSATAGWVKTDLASIKATDVVVIVDETSATAMPNDNGASNAPQATAVSLNSDKTRIEGDVAENLKWNIIADGTNYTIHPNGITETWLYSTSSNNGIRVGDGENKLFNWSEGYLKNTALGRYVGVYNNQDWRSYTTIHANIANTVTSFYVYTEGDEGGEEPGEGGGEEPGDDPVVPEIPTKGDTYRLVTSNSELEANEKYIIVAAESNYAMSTTQKDNNRGQNLITKNGNLITLSKESIANVQVLTLEQGTIDDTWAFNTGAGYLYAAGGTSSNNFLRTKNNKDEVASAIIAVSTEGIASIVFQGEVSRNTLKYNSSSSLFSCYASGQTDVSLYKYIKTVATPVISINGDDMISITCATEGATIYYTIDGTTPTTSSTEYTEAFKLTVSSLTVNAIAVKDGWKNSTVASAALVPTAIEEVGVDAGEAVYYNLQGVKVANPENGIFIKKQGGRTSKVVL